MARNPGPHDSLDVATFADESLAGRPANDLLERRTGLEAHILARVEERAVLGVAEHQAIVRVVEGEALGCALDRVDQSLPRLGHVAEILLLDLDRGVAEDRQCLGHAANLVAAGGWRLDFEIAARDGEHAAAECTQARTEAALAVEPDDDHHGDDADTGAEEREPAGAHGTPGRRRSPRAIFPRDGDDVIRRLGERLDEPQALLQEQLPFGDRLQLRLAKNEDVALVRAEADQRGRRLDDGYHRAPVLVLAQDLLSSSSADHTKRDRDTSS